MALEEACVYDDAVHRKEAFQHDRIMFCVPRTYCEEHGSYTRDPCKSGARDEGTCPFPPFEHIYRQLLCADGKTGNGCQLSATRTSATERVRVLRANLRRCTLICVVLREWLLIVTQMQCAVRKNRFPLT